MYTIQCGSFKDKVGVLIVTEKGSVSIKSERLEGRAMLSWR